MRNFHILLQPMPMQTNLQREKANEIGGGSRKENIKGGISLDFRIRIVGYSRIEQFSVSLSKFKLHSSSLDY